MFNVNWWCATKHIVSKLASIFNCMDSYNDFTNMSLSNIQVKIPNQSALCTVHAFSKDIYVPILLYT